MIQNIPIHIVGQVEAHVVELPKLIAYHGRTHLDNRGANCSCVMLVLGRNLNVVTFTGIYHHVIFLE